MNCIQYMTGKVQKYIFDFCLAKREQNIFFKFLKKTIENSPAFVQANKQKTNSKRKEICLPRIFSIVLNC